MNAIRFGIIGFGWRTEAYLRIASQLPHLFKAVGVVVRDQAKYEEAAAEWGLKLYQSPEELAEHCDFLLTAVSKTSTPSLLKQLASIGKPIMAETPPAADEEGIKIISALISEGAPIQIAEQYPLQPYHAARTALISSGAIGEVSHVQVSAGHGYHGVSLIRHWLSLPHSSSCEIVARRFKFPIQEVPHRGRAVQGNLETDQQDIAILTFQDGKSAVLDFAGSQYFSPLRHNRVLIRGSHGEIRDNEVTRSLGAVDYETITISRQQDGLEGSLAPLSLRELRAGSECLFRNPYYPASLSDEEIAIAEALSRMTTYVREGVSFYSLSEALIDVKLAMAIDEAIATGESVKVI
ncbi:Gfo/Idh/MocA family oxidoreductase [Paenibacillus lupini]|uniref:Gfo/Idh/MocA family protein n=1 Tax=Paenibacillus lupini TaxID=1450204 RepID=UPI00141DFD95|nr:Gfo/Idh/MocA family oxidoreductase [Paenibacillus lupini]NIK22171.1 putative dehydrogenase [Paenibacillus lupini]